MKIPCLERLSLYWNEALVLLTNAASRHLGRVENFLFGIYGTSNGFLTNSRFLWIMMTSPNGNIFSVTGLLCGEFTGPRWIPHTKASGAELWFFSLIRAWINGWVNNYEAGDYRRHRAHYDVTVMMSCPAGDKIYTLNWMKNEAYKISFTWTGSQIWIRVNCWQYMPLNAAHDLMMIIQYYQIAPVSPCPSVSSSVCRRFRVRSITSQNAGVLVALVLPTSFLITLLTLMKSYHGPAAIEAALTNKGKFIKWLHYRNS